MEDYFKTMHSYMDKGWKTTFGNCDQPGCKGSLLLANLAEKKTFCPKCKVESPAEFEVTQTTGYDDFEEDDEDQEQDYDKLATQLLEKNKQPINNVDRQKKQEDDDHKSKKMGEYLLAGYTMLQSSCEDCLVPLFADFSKRRFCPSCNKIQQDKPATDVSLSKPAVPTKPSVPVPKPSVQTPNGLSHLSPSPQLAPTQAHVPASFTPTNQPARPAVNNSAQPVQVSPPVIPATNPERPVVAAHAVAQEIEAIRLGCMYQAVQEIYQKPGLSYQDKSLLINEFLKKANYFNANH